MPRVPATRHDHRHAQEIQKREEKKKEKNRKNEKGERKLTVRGCEERLIDKVNVPSNNGEISFEWKKGEREARGYEKRHVDQ